MGMFAFWEKSSYKKHKFDIKFARQQHADCDRSFIKTAKRAVDKSKIVEISYA
jgi:hypothetical protein